jgi:diguanylate cyclase (GGDEF)-like protein
MGDLGTAPGADEHVDPAHRRFRSWALQHDLVELLGGGSNWRSDGDGLNLEPEAAGHEDHTIRGQGYLREALKADPRLQLRTWTAVSLWSVALLTIAFNQITSTTIALPAGAFWTGVLTISIALAFSALAFPQLGPAQFRVAEQIGLLIACGLILFLCSKTGSVRSPVTLWFVLLTFNVAYLLPTQQAVANIAGFTVLIFGLCASTSLPVDDSAFLPMLALIVTMWAVGWALIQQRRNEVTLKRAVTFLALADPLTATSNSRSFENYLDQIVRGDDQRFAIFVADINGLKAANAVFGHQTGDEMVMRMGRLMLQASGANDQVARFGGDEFAVVIPGAGQAEAQKWREGFEQLVERHNSIVRGRLPQISVSLGVANYPNDAVRTNELIDVADRRMYREKQNVVAPPYEREAFSAPDAGRAFRSSSLYNPPEHPVDNRDRMRTAAINWAACGLIALGAALVGGEFVNRPVSLALAVCAFALALLSWFLRDRTLTSSMALGLDFATVVSPLPLIWATGGAESPMLIMVMMPIVLYAQTFPRRIAIPRIAILLIGYSIAFWLTGTHSDVNISRYIAATTALVVSAWIMQNSQAQLRGSLKLIRSSARVDALTGLPGVYALRTDLATAIEKLDQAGDGSPLALLVIDLDNFHRANALAGHSSGDDLLRRTARRLFEMSPEGSVYRVDGDEFAIVARGTAARSADELGRSCQRAVSCDLRIGEEKLAITASWGCSQWQSGLSGDQLMDRAEEMLWTHKTERSDDRPRGGQILL